MHETVLVQVSDYVAELSINRPEVYNALDEDTLRLLKMRVEQLAEDPQTRVIIIKSTHPKAFVSGADIAFMVNNSPEKAERFCDLGFQAFEALQACEKPVIAAINGHCLGGGLELAMACDLRIVSCNAKLGFPEVKLGIIPGWGGLNRTALEIGISKAKDLMFTGRILSAEEALSCGLVNRVVAPEQLEEVCKETARMIAANAPVAIGLIKKHIKAAAYSDAATANAIADHAMGICFSTADQKEGMRAFLEKRTPVFTGK